MTTWRISINELLKELNETLEFCTLSDDELDLEFDPGFGQREGKPFTAWTKTYVLFPVVYDGSEWVGYTYRNQDPNHVTYHQGGE